MDDQIYEAVKNRYGHIAASFEPLSGAAAEVCCSPEGDCCTPGDASLVPSASLYDAAVTQELPFDVTGLSLGCGDPVTIAGLQPGEHVLDLGSGAGMDCFLAAKQVGPAGQVIGVDMTPEMIAKAEANRDKLGLNNVTFRQGMIEALPVAENSIDVVMSNCVINLAPDKLTVFKEAFRVLKPGGRLSISDIVTEGDFDDEARIQLDAWSECVVGAIDVGRYQALLAEAGFAAISVQDKVNADGIVPVSAEGPRVYSARITARKA